MYGLKQAARLAHDTLVKTLHLLGMNQIKFILIFGHIRQEKQSSVYVLMILVLNTLTRQNFIIYNKIFTENGGGFTLTWNYNKGYVDISMLCCIERLCDKFNHPPPTTLQFSQHEYVHIK